jgi:two-component SAPR family response regulator
VVAGLGLEPVTPDALSDGQHGTIDAMVIEPGHEPMLELACAVRRARPTAAVVCVSIYPPEAEARALEPVAYLIKPFALATLQEAILEAVERARADEQAVLA